MFNACFSSQPDHAPYSVVTVIYGYFSMKAATAFSVASCLESPPHQENFNSTGSWLSAASPAAEDSAAAVVSAAAAVVSFAVLLPPHAAKDSVMAEASVRDIAFLMLLLIIITLPFLFCVRSWLQFLILQRFAQFYKKLCTFDIPAALRLYCVKNMHHFLLISVL